MCVQEPMDLETRIAQIIKGVEATERKSEEEAAAVAMAAAAPSTTSTSGKSRSSKKDSRQAFQTRPYNEEATGGEDVMDDEELHSLLGV